MAASIPLLISINQSINIIRTLKSPVLGVVLYIRIYVYIHVGWNNNNNTIIFLALESITPPLPGSSPGPPSFYLSHHYPFH